MAPRYQVEPRLISPEKAARRLGLSLGAFEGRLPLLERDGFPKAHPIIGNYDIQAIDAWITAFNAHLLLASDKHDSQPKAVNAEYLLGGSMRRAANGQ